MLRTLFPRVHPRYERSYCAADLEKFGEWLLAAGYSRKNTCDHLRRCKCIFERSGTWTNGKKFTAEDLSALFTVRQAPAYRSTLNTATRRAYERFLTSENRLILTQVESTQLSVCLDDYEKFLIEVRGFADSTSSRHLSTTSEFLFQSLLPTLPLDQLTQRNVDQYLAAKSTKITRQSLQHIVAHLRAFLRYSFDIDNISTRLDRIDMPRTYRGEKPPRALPWTSVLGLLRSIKKEEKAGRRDYTILHLMAYYGLRPSEIAALTLSSVDFKAGNLFVDQRKTRSKLILPLSSKSIRILQNYLKHGRSAAEQHQQLFLRVRRPSGGIKNYAVCEIFEKHILKYGLKIGQYSSYSLRHSFAMRLLQRGVGVKAIGDLLGHSCLESTCVYLRLDTQTLRKVALPVPSQARKGDRS